MEKLLPKGWGLSRLGYLGQYLNGRAFKPSEWKSEGLPIVRIQNLNNLNAPFNYTNETYEDKYSIDNGNLLMAWSASLGVYFWEKGPAWLNQHIFKVLPNERIVTKRFLYYSLLVSIDDFYGKTHGTGMVHITKPVFENHEVPLPPLPEQERIVVKLDKLFAQHKKIKKALDRIPQLLKAFRQQVLTQAVTGKLLKPQKTGQFEDYSISIITGPFGSALHKSDYVDNGIPVINPSHIKNGRIDIDPKVSIDMAKFQSLKSWQLLKDDVILGRRGEMGRAAPVEGSNSMLCGTGSVILRSNKIDPKFLTLYLRSDFCVNFLTNNSVGSTMVNLNQKILKSLPIPLYPIQQQQEIVGRVEGLFAKADAIEARYYKLKEKVDTLPQAILHKAFKGELVSQLPSDGDAKDLLAEIMALKRGVKGNGKKK